jgi:hypothetical protein
VEYLLRVADGRWCAGLGSSSFSSSSSLIWLLPDLLPLPVFVVVLSVNRQRALAQRAAPVVQLDTRPRGAVSLPQDTREVTKVMVVVMVIWLVQ